MKLGCYEYGIMYRPRKNNIPADKLSRAQCNTLNNMGRLYEIHENLCQESQWETVLPEVLRSIRSLLCAATNATPHERLFSYQKRTPSGHSLPTWLSTPGPVLLRRHVQARKYEPLVDEVVLLPPICTLKIRQWSRIYSLCK